MSASLFMPGPFEPAGDKWPRSPRLRRTGTGAAARGPAAAPAPATPDPVGYRGGPLPGQVRWGAPEAPVRATAPGGWRASLMRWLAAMPHEFPPRP